MLSVKCLRYFIRLFGITFLICDTTSSLLDEAKITDSQSRILVVKFNLSPTVVTHAHGFLSTFIEGHLLHYFDDLSALRELESGVQWLAKATEVIPVSTPNLLGTFILAIYSSGLFD